MEEIWKAVVGYEGSYEVSNLGRVKSLSRMVYNGHVNRTTEERVLKSTLDGNGYPHVSICNDGIKKTAMVHQLMAIAFLGHTRSGLALVVDHINGVKTDNRVENIRIVTNRFNSSLGFRKNQDRLSSKYTGVYWNRSTKKWKAQIGIDGKRKYLGVYKNELDALNAYQVALSKLTEV